MSEKIIFRLIEGAKGLSIDFRCYPPDNYSHVGENGTIPKDKIHIDPQKNELTVAIDLKGKSNKEESNKEENGKDNRNKTAKWYGAFVGDETYHMVHTEGGDNLPKNLNLALRGLLKIGETEYPICFGQGNHGIGGHNWHLCSKEILARPNNKKAYFTNAYFIDPSGSHVFEFKLSKDINTGIGINIWAYTGAADLMPRFDYEGDALHAYPYQKSTLGNVGTMDAGKTFDTRGIAPLHRQLHLQVLNPGNKICLTEEVYEINRITGTIGGKDVAKQTVAVFNDGDGKACLMNYGISHAAEPLCDQSYIYTGKENRRWMEKLAKECPGIQIKDLVLAGSHDAGMYTLNLNLKNEAFYYLMIDRLLTLLELTVILAPVAIEIKVIIAKNGLDVALGNFSITQKDTAFNQMLIGTRYFDFRPAYDKTTPDKWLTQTYHIHGFIPGVNFTAFLQDINRYLENNPGEIAVINVNDQGLNDNFTPLNKAQVNEFLQKNISGKVGYRLLENENAGEFTEQTLSEVVDSGLRVIVLYGSMNTNDSYNDTDYSASLTDPKDVLRALNETLENPATGTLYTILQLQDTGSAALYKHYIGQVLLDAMSWANDLLGSKTGNILQATKPIFDHATYQWLTKKETVDGINRQPGFVVLLNDFVDISQSEHAIALTGEKYRAKKK